MTEPFDPFEILENLDPIDVTSVRDAAASPEARAALANILSQPRSAPRRRWPLPTFFRSASGRRTYLAIAVAAAIATAGTAWALTRSPTQHLTIGCYATDNIAAHTVVVPSGRGSAISTCRDVWLRGAFGGRTAPPLQACVLASGSIGVFPSADRHACQRMKLEPITGAPNITRPAHKEKKAGSVIDLKNALVHAYLTHRCIGRRAGLQLTRSFISRLDLAAWHVKATTPHTRQRPCSSFAFDEENETVLLIPTPPRP